MFAPLNKIKQELALSYWISVRKKQSNIYISSGMPRSGTTLLYNILLIALRNNCADNFGAGWVGDIKSFPVSGNYLIKTHAIYPAFYKNADKILYSYRDIRTALVSRRNIFGDSSMKIGGPKAMKWVDSQIEQYKIAKKKANICIKYEEFMKAQTSVITELLFEFNIDGDATEILKSIEDIKPPAKSDEDTNNRSYSQETLMHPNHITGTKENDWKSDIEGEFLKKLLQKYEWWFDECNYPLN